MHTTPQINYEILLTALNHYKQEGFEYREVPWIISHPAYVATRPNNRPEFYTLGGYLVASGEQGYIQQLQEGVVLGKHICVTPCYREEEILDEIHYRYFLKAELINTHVTQENLHEMIRIAKDFFNNYTVVHVIQTDTQGNAYDIIDTSTGVELGSYGIRTIEGHRFIYGTAVAQPRLDVVIAKQK